MASKKRPAGTNAGNNDRPAQKRQAQAPAPVTGQDAGGEPLPPLPGAGAPAQASGSDAPGDAQGTAAKAAPEKKHAAAKNGTAQQATTAKTVQEATAPAGDAPGARALAGGEAPVEAAAAGVADDDDDLGTDTPARKAAEARKDAARKMDRQADKKTAAGKQAVAAGKAPTDGKAPAGKKTAADKKKDAAKAAKADGGKKATDGKKGSGKDAAKAKTAKKRAKLAAPEPEDLPCAALLEHLLPNSPELEATCRHGRHVAHLAEQLFEQLAPLHGLDGRWGYRLRLACCLHDIGFISGRKEHHKKGMRMVEQDTSLPLLPGDRNLVAQLVRYHRKAWPAARHRRFSALGKKDREALCRAAALIRMADALDYRHMEAVQDVSVELRPGKAVLTLSGAGDCTPEQDRLLVKGDLFMHIFGVELECVCPML